MKCLGLALGVGLASVLAIACGSSESSMPSGTSSSSSSSGGECNDCGQCGIAGPVNVTAMEARTFGVDAMGRAAVTLSLAKVGECRGEDAHSSTLHFASNYDVELTPGAEMLDRSKATADTSKAGETVYVWNDRDLLVKVFKVGQKQDELVLAFASGGVDVRNVQCEPSGDYGACSHTE